MSILTVTMKATILSALLLDSVSSCNNTNNNAKQNNTTKKDTIGYNFPVPQGWTTERIPFPIEFATQIPYTGFEDLRFASGWEFTSSEEHWTYAFLWWLEGKPQIDENVLQNNLKDYYTGLVGRNITKRMIPANKQVPIVASIKKTEPSENDIETYSGTINILDYLDVTYPAISLHCLIHRKSCNARTALIFEISPKPSDHKVWQQLNKLNKDFECEN